MKDAGKQAEERDAGYRKAREPESRTTEESTKKGRVFRERRCRKEVKRTREGESQYL